MTRPYTIHDVDQRTEAWRKLRAGRVTASAASAMFATRKDKTEAAPRRDLRTQLACERITGEPQEDAFLARDMVRGIEVEEAAFTAYELAIEQAVFRVGFITHNELAAGYSPDGVVGDMQGLTELKCPRAANHLAYLRGKTLPPEWQWQVTHALWITGAPWCDFATYCAQVPEGLRLFRVRVTKTPQELAAYEIMLRSFIAEVDREVAEVLALIPQAQEVA